MLKVLIADDDTNVGQCLSRLVPWDDIGYRVVGVALNGNEAFAMANRLEPDVIISDIVMPMMDGMDLCIKTKEINSNTAFIFLSAYEDFNAAQLALRYRVVDYLLKPMDRNKINRLTDLLKNIRADMEQSSIFHAIAFDKRMETTMVDAIQHKDISFFESLFCQIDSDIDRMERDITEVRETGFKLLDLLYSHFDRKRPFIPAVYQTMINCTDPAEAIKMILETYRLALSQSDAEKEPHRRWIADQVCKYIDNHIFDMNLSVSTLSSVFHYSPDYLSRLFAQNKHETIMRYLTNKRMESAAELLLYTNLSIAHIAERVGYRSAGYFTQGFRKKYGITPYSYRIVNSDGIERHDQV